MSNATKRPMTARLPGRRTQSRDEIEMWAEWNRLKAREFPYFTKKVLPIMREADRLGRNIYEI